MGRVRWAEQVYTGFGLSVLKCSRGLNEVKDREDFRPVAPVVLEEEAANWFEDAGYSPFYVVCVQRETGKG